MRKGRRSEKIAKCFVEGLGFQNVQLTKFHGPDLSCERDGRTFTVEVKSAVRKSENCWIVSRVYPARCLDDLIAIVLPDDSVHLCPMSEHLKLCNKGGARTITGLVLGGAA
jgi:hypothetical protein